MHSTSAEYPQQTIIQVQANATAQDVLSGQYSAGVALARDSAHRNASFTGLLLHALPGAYNITFSAINNLVSVLQRRVLCLGSKWQSLTDVIGSLHLFMKRCC